MTTLEQVEKLRERANVSYDEAKAALDASGGDLLEAIIYLEKQGKAKAPAGEGFYSSEKANSQDAGQTFENKTKSTNRGAAFSDLLKQFGRFCLTLIRKGNCNTFEVLKGEENKASVPVTVLVLMLLFAFWITLPLMIIGLFFGLRYRFAGPDLESATVNSAMDSAAKAAEDLKKSINEKNNENGD
jgi:hypothetical protein